MAISQDKNEAEKQAELGPAVPRGVAIVINVLKASMLGGLMAFFYFAVTLVWYFALGDWSGVIWSVCGLGLVLVVMSSALGLLIGNQCVKPAYSFPASGKALTQSGLAPYLFSTKHDPMTDMNIPFEDVQFREPKTGRTLRGWLVRPAEGEDSKRGEMIVFVHGGGRDRRAWVRHLPVYRGAGYACLLFDLSGHGSSDLDTAGIGMSVREHEDVSAAIEYSQKSLKYKRIHLAGTSLGGASAIIAASQHQRPSGGAVVSVLAENPFTGAIANVENVVENIAFLNVLCRKNKTAHAAMWPLRFLTRTAARAYFLRSIGHAAMSTHKDAIDVIGDIRIPVFFIHGKNDLLVPFGESERLYAKSRQESTKLWLIEGGNHCQLYDIAKDEYARRTLDFFASA